MTRNEDLKCLVDFRQKIERFLDSRQSAAEDPFSRSIDAEATARMLGTPVRSKANDLVREINEMKPRVKKILEGLNLKPVMIEYPPLAIGGPILQFDVLDLITDTTSDAIVPRDHIVGVLDQAVGALKTGAIENESENIFTYDFSKIHPRIRKECESLFRDGHYAESILKAYKVIAAMVKEKTRIDEDGRALMSDVFSPKSPIIRLNKMGNQSEKDEQEGFMLLFMGAMVGIRNPKAHDLIDQRDPVRAFEYLVFASLLARRVDEGELSQNKTSPK